MKKIVLALMSLLVIGIFLVSCTPKDSSEDTALAGEAISRIAKIGIGKGPCKSNSQCVSNAICYLDDSAAPNYQKCVAVSSGYKNKAGGICGSSEDCQSGLTCYLDDPTAPNYHKCVAVSAGYQNPAGGVCGSSNDCLPGLTCYLEDPTAPNYHKCVAISPGNK